MDAQIKHNAKLALTLIGPFVAVVGIMLTIGMCDPSWKVKAEIRGELDGRLKSVTDAASKYEDLNRTTHTQIFGELKEQRDMIQKNQVEILRELRSVGSAPSGPSFSRGKRIDK